VFEDQADRLAVRLMAKAGFDPWAGSRFMRRYGISFDRSSTRASIHRPAQQRADLMEAEIAKMKSEQGE
jgi:predicted Zn-dependent protease